MKRLVLPIFLTLLTWGNAIATAQTTGGNIQGYVIDASSEEPLPGVNIHLEGTTRGTTTDSKGFFMLRRLQAGTHRVVFSMLGYATEQVEAVAVSEGDTRNLGHIRLTKEAIGLDEIVVMPGQFAIMGSAALAQQTLTSEQIKNMSWAEDVTRAVARLPGMSSSDYSSKFTIRGGESDEVLIALDGMELYEPFHQRDYSGGLFSIVDIETIDGIDLMTGGFSAAYGNRMSGVFNMHTKSVAPGQQTTTLGLSVMNARLHTQGTFADGKASYLFSARRGMLDLLFESVGFTENLPYFYDTMGKVTHALDANHTLSAYVLHAGDRTKVRDISEDGNFDRNDTEYTNTYSWFTLNAVPNPRLFSRTLAYVGRIHHDRRGQFHKFEYSDKGNFLLSDQRDYTFFGLKQDATWEPAGNVLLMGGLEVKRVAAEYDYFLDLHELRVNAHEEIRPYDVTRDLVLSPTGEQAGAYLSVRVRLARRVVAEPGIRYDYASYSNDRVWSPRVGVVYAVRPATFVRAAWGRYYQSPFINALNVNGGETVFASAELAEHYVLGVEHLWKRGVSLRIEAYHKELSHLQPFWQNMRDHLEMFPEQRNDYVRVILNGARARGIEVFLKYDQGGRYSWWLSYALAEAKDDVQALAFDGLLTRRTGTVPRLNNQRHTIYADLNYRPSTKWHLNLSWQYYQGWPRTDYTYDLQTLPDGNLHFYQIHGAFNGVEYPAYHRMDIRLNRQMRAKRGTLTSFLHLINVYNRQNLKKFDLDVVNDQEEPSLDSQGNYVPFEDNTYWFGFIPVIGVSWTL